MKTTLAWILILVPLLFVVMAYHEGGLFGIFMYAFYSFMVAVTIFSPKMGINLLRNN